MALVDASRVSELQALDLRYRPEGIVFQIPTLGKKRIVGVPPKQIMFGAFLGDSRLCVIKNLRQYEGNMKQPPLITEERNQVVINLCFCLTFAPMAWLLPNA